MTRITIITLLAITACADDDRNPPAPISSATENEPDCEHQLTGEPMCPDTTSESSSSGSSDESTSTGPLEPGPCAAYNGCVDACTDDACREDCASATGVAVAYCDMLRCDELSDDCANGDAYACHRLPECAPESESSSDSISSGESESSGSSDETSGSESSGSSDEASSGESTT